MTGLEIIAKGAVAVVLILIVVNAYGKAPKIAYGILETVDKMLENLGINIIYLPKIVSVTTSVNSDGFLIAKWVLNRDGREKLGSADFKAVFFNRQFPNSEIRDVCTAYLIDSITEPKDGFYCTIDRDRFKQEAVLVDDRCVKPGECGKETYAPAPAGGYKVQVSFKEKGKAEFKGTKDDNLAFYRENYAELMNNPEGCSSCWVITCKKSNINHNYFSAPLASVKDVIKDVSDDFRTEKGFDISVSCGKVKESGIVFETDGCTDADINDLNVKVSRVRMAVAQRSYPGAPVDELKDLAVKSTMSCTKTWTEEALAPKGLYNELGSLGWVPVGDFLMEKRIVAELNPVITDPQAAVNDDATIVLSWNVALGIERVSRGSYKIVQSYRQWIGGLTGKSSTEETVLPGSIGEVLTMSFSTAPGQPLGKHGFEIKVFEGPDATGKELFTTTTSAGMFDDGYIETYKGGIEGCKTKLLPDSGLEDCNVDAQKRKEMKTGITGDAEEMEKQGRIKAAYAKSGVNKELCKYKKGLSTYGFTEGCTSEEIDEIYHNFIDMIQPDDYYCKTPFRFGHFEAGHVCAVKRQVVNTFGPLDLGGLGWKDLRVNKGWEADV